MIRGTGSEPSRSLDRQGLPGTLAGVGVLCKAGAASVGSFALRLVRRNLGGQCRARATPHFDTVVGKSLRHRPSTSVVFDFDFDIVASALGNEMSFSSADARRVAGNDEKTTSKGPRGGLVTFWQPPIQIRSQRGFRSHFGSSRAAPFSEAADGASASSKAAPTGLGGPAASMAARAGDAEGQPPALKKTPNDTNEGKYPTDPMECGQSPMVLRPPPLGWRAF